MCRAPIPMTEKYTFFSSLHGALPKSDYLFGQKAVSTNDTVTAYRLCPLTTVKYQEQIRKSLYT